MHLTPMFYETFSFFLGIGAAAAIVAGVFYLGAITLNALDAYVQRKTR